MSYRLFLDDIRNPKDVKWIELPLGPWVIVRSYDEFVDKITEKGIPSFVSFDHDLGLDVENWKDIQGYEGIYRISSLGRIARIKASQGTKNLVLHPYFHKDTGGLTVRLRDCGKDKCFSVHRLVAMAFIPNLSLRPEVNHLDGNRCNNRADNLEWVTGSENVQHSHDQLDRSFSAYGENHANSKTVACYKDVELVAVYGSANEAGRQTGIDFTNIAAVCRGKRKSAGGFVWSYSDLDVTHPSEIEVLDDKTYERKEIIFKEKTGFSCAEWLVQQCTDQNVDIPGYACHSMNPIGRENITGIMESAIRFKKGTVI